MTPISSLPPDLHLRRTRRPSGPFSEVDRSRLASAPDIVIRISKRGDRLRAAGQTERNCVDGDLTPRDGPRTRVPKCRPKSGRFLDSFHQMVPVRVHRAPELHFAYPDGRI